MDTKYLGTKNILFSIINKGETESSDYAIAYYLLSHYRDIKEISIRDMSQQCFVDRSTIRRFFIKYGYENFLDFKKHYSDQFEEHYSRPIPFDNYNSYIDDLNAKICGMMDRYTLKRDKTRDIDGVNERLHRSARIILMGDESFYGNMYTIQQHFLSMGKIVFVITTNVYHNAVLDHVTADDCILVLSLMGKYWRTIEEIIAPLPCQKMLLTLNAQSQQGSCFDYVAQLTAEPERADEEIYRKYAVTYYIDIMLTTYKMKYQK